MYKILLLFQYEMKGDFFMARHKVEICGVNTANIEVLTNEEQIELFKKFQAGDLMAKERLINGNLKLVLSVLKKFTNRSDNMDDLFQVGCIGLIKAIENFDLSYDVRFSTYSVPMISGEIKRFLRDNNSIRISRSIKDIAYKSLKVKEELISSLGREVTNAEIAEALNITEFEVTNALESMRDTISMFEPIYNDGGDTIYLSDQLADHKNDLYDDDTKLTVKNAIEKLKEKERYILLSRYIYGKTQMELAEEIGISQAQISRLEKNGIANIKRNIS